MRKTSSSRSIRLHPSPNGRCTEVIENSTKVRMSRYFDTSTKAQMAQIIVRIEDPVVLLYWQDYYRTGNSGKFYWNTVGKNVPNWECSFVKREKGLFLSVYVDDLMLAGKKQNISPTWKILKTFIWENQHGSFTMCYLFALRENVR